MTVKISFDFEDMKWIDLPISQVKFWEAAYPGINVIDILVYKIPCWLDANPRKAKKKLWKKFIVGWLSREQTKYDLKGGIR